MTMIIMLAVAVTCALIFAMWG